MSAKPLGVVGDVQQYGGPPLLVVQYEGREVLIPFVPAICDVDLSGTGDSRDSSGRFIGAIGRA